MNSAEGRGPTLDEAIDAALITLGESRRNVDVNVLSENPDETVVEVVRIDAEAAPEAPGDEALGDEEVEAAREMVSQLLTLMGVRCQVTAQAGSESIAVDVSGRDLGQLIGWRGETLRAIQTVTNLLASRRLAGGRRVVVDIERYRQRRENTVREIALRAARQVKATGDPITLDAMQAFERRAIHLVLEADPNVTTASVGQDPERRVVVGPRLESE
ncbi:MAG TPA: RNA-binding cell elongation regulator Jag/EloR [Candidatus Acidoferrales bacterium]|nr:RNA-binding cell elongation regulator Jag/EloR [Candidatus Acidoferrales bacterium]